jgi:hypothetical protein
LKKWHLFLFATAWMVAVGAGFGLVTEYEYTAARVTAVPVHWPRQSKIPRPTRKPMLIMFAHPRCPCTRASVEELAVLMTRCQNQLDARVIFFQPHGTEPDWPHTDLWRSAEAIPRVVAQVDEDGTEARSFEATTSGQVLLYDCNGRLLFSGGITSGRGHSGDNAGLLALTQLLNHQMVVATKTPVFGCSLLDPAQPGAATGVVCGHCLRP